MERDAAICDKCALKGSPCIFGYRKFLDEPRRPLILFYGEAPGESELKSGYVFAGSSGNLLIETLKENDLLAHAVLSNVVRCVPEVRGERWWDNPAILCDKYIFKEIRELEPDMVVALGEAALHYLLGRSRKKVAAGRIAELTILNWRRMPVLVTYNPAFIIRNAARHIEEAFKGHIRRLKDFMERARTTASADLTPQIHDYLVYENYDEELEDLLTCVRGAQFKDKFKRVALDIEVGSFNNYSYYHDIGKSPTSEIILVGIGTDTLYKGFVLYENGRKIFDIGKFSALKKLLTEGEFWIYMHNAPFEICWFLRKLHVYPRKFIDTMTFAHLMNENLPSYSLDGLVRALRIDIDIPFWKEWVGDVENYATVELPKLAAYNMYDVAATYKLGERLRSLLAEVKPDEVRNAMRRFLAEVSWRIAVLVGHITATGIPASMERQAQVILELEQRKRELESMLKESAPAVQNFLSTPQIYSYLKSIGVHEVDKYRTSKGNPSLTKSVIEQLIEERPDVEFLKTLLDYKETVKLASTYIAALPKYIHPTTGRIYPNLHTTGTKTGRLSSSNPPLQNYPSERLSLGKLVRKVFKAPQGYSFISCDAKQHELRVLAVLSGDENLRGAFLSGKDVHAYNASLILKKPIEEITGVERQVGKKLSFAVVYGVSPEGAKDIFGLPSVEEGRKLLDTIKGIFKKAIMYIESKQKEILKFPHLVLSPLGRPRRPLADVIVKKGSLSANSSAIQRAMRQAGNFVIQSTASDLWCLVAYYVFEKFHECGWDLGSAPAANICILIHDSMYICCRDELVHDVLEIIKGALAKVSATHFNSADLPITAEYAVYKTDLGDEPIETGEWSIEEIKEAIKERLWEKEYTVRPQQQQEEETKQNGQETEKQRKPTQLSLFD